MINLVEKARLAEFLLKLSNAQDGSTRDPAMVEVTFDEAKALKKLLREHLSDREISEAGVRLYGDEFCGTCEGVSQGHTCCPPSE